MISARSAALRSSLRQRGMVFFICYPALTPSARKRASGRTGLSYVAPTALDCEWGSEVSTGDQCRGDTPTPGTRCKSAVFFDCTKLRFVQFVQWRHIVQPLADRIAVIIGVISHNAVYEGFWIERGSREMLCVIIFCKNSAMVWLPYIACCGRNRERIIFFG